MRHLLPILALGVPMLVAGWRGVPCHWIAAALDPEFTGWVAPVAARFAGGFRLYTDGGHSPLPPLSFVAAYVAGLGHPIWWHESLANFFFQCLAVVAIFGAVRRIVSPVAALVVALGTFGVFVGLAKTLLYDALAQAGVAVLGYAALRWWETRSSRLLVTAALAGTVAVLSKHNTGGAALLGAGAVTLLVGRDLRASATLVLATCVSVALALLAMLPFADPMGLWVDVVRHGSEPKGGTAFLWEHLHAYRDELLSWPSEPVVLRAALYGLAVAVVTALLRRGPRSLQALGVLALVWLPATVAHSLSGRAFRWTFDNNPVIGAAFAAVMLAATILPRRLGLLVGAAFVAAAAMPCVRLFMAHTALCTESWPEVAYLDGAYMAPRAAPLRALGAELRTRTAPNDTVLLLPEDPDLFATFNRPRPRLTSAIVYVDQYWDRFVEYDLARLRAKPPAVIILGTNATRFAQTFFDGTGRRVHRLMVALESDLLPTRYRYEGERHWLGFYGKDQWVRLYVRHGVH